MLKFIKKTAFLVAMAFLVISCSNKLDRDKAEKLIIEHYEYPNAETTTIPTYIPYKDMRLYLHEDLSDSLVHGEASGGGFGPYGIMKSTVHLDLTDKGKVYAFDTLDNIVLLNERKFKQITGIKFNENETEAEVDFTVVRMNITPFGLNREHKNDEEVNYKVHLSLYDDGWRIEEKKTQNIKFPESLK